MDIWIALAVSLAFSVILGFIEICYQSKASVKTVVGPAFAFYLMILGIGNCATTLLAAATLSAPPSKSAHPQDTAKMPPSDAAAVVPGVEEPGESAHPQDTAKKPPSDVAAVIPGAEEPGGRNGSELSGPMWFWFAFVGVFGFEVVLQNINLTFANKGVLTISDWINKARDPAVAAAVKAQTNLESNREQAIATRLKQVPDADLNAQLVAIIGADALKKLMADTQASGADVALSKALTLAFTDLDKAEAIANANNV